MRSSARQLGYFDEQVVHGRAERKANCRVCCIVVEAKGIEAEAHGGDDSMRLGRER